MNHPVVYKKRNYRPAITGISLFLIIAVGILFGLPGVEDFDAFDVTILPFINAVLNSFTFLFLLSALIAILKKHYCSPQVHLRCFYNDISVSDHVCHLSLFSPLHPIRRNRMVGGIVLFYTHFPCAFGCGHRAAGINKRGPRLEHGK